MMTLRKLSLSLQILGHVCLPSLLFSASSLPSWVTNPEIPSANKNINIVCQGKGPAIDIARREAIATCKSSAIDILSHEGQSKHILIQTETDTSLHVEHQSNLTYRNLRCELIREYVEESKGTYLVWIECLFNKEKIEIVPLKVEATMKRDSLIDQPSIQIPRSTPYVQSAFNRVLQLSVVPICDRIMVKGKYSRVLSCADNPIKLSLREGDIELLVIRNGYNTRRINLKSKNWDNYETLQIILNSN